jgi:hypothetical protein
MPLKFLDFLVEDSMRLASSNLKSIRYNAKTEELLVYFRSGSIYSYDGVPRSIVQSLKFAESRGRYFWRYIRMSFPYTKVRGPNPGFKNAFNIAKDSVPQRHLLNVPPKSKPFPHPNLKIGKGTARQISP